jgi:DNA-binding MarR family transcriptional regulator
LQRRWKPLNALPVSSGAAALSRSIDFGGAAASPPARRHQGRIRSPRPRRHQFGAGAAALQHRRQGIDRGELRTRGYYLGSNVSYNLKKLVELGFLDHQRSRVDRRSVRIRLTAQGQEIRKIVDALYQKHVKTVEQVGGISNEEFATLNKSLHRLERFWTDQILYRL